MQRAIAVTASYAWRLLVIAAAAAGALWLLGRLRFVVLALAVAVFLVQVLGPPAAWLRRHRLRAGLASAAVLLAFLGLVTGVLLLIGVAVADGAGDLGTTLNTALDDVETWVVEDGPLSVSRAEVEEFRADLGEAIRDTFASSGGAMVSRALAAAEAAVAVLIGLVVAFFTLKDGDRFGVWARGWVPARHRPLAERLAHRAWRAIGGYLRGAATLGLVEGTIVAVTLALAGADLALPVAVLTFVAAFVPFVGAVVAGVVAVLVALADAGTGAAVVVALVMLAVQQVDNELLAPLVYGRMLSLHPVAVLLAVAAGGSLFGLAGTFLAVPVTAVAVEVVRELRDDGTKAPARSGRTALRVPTAARDAPGDTEEGEPS